MVDQPSGEPVGEPSNPRTVLSFNQVGVAHAIMHEHDHTGRMHQHLPADDNLVAVVPRQCDSTIIDMEYSTPVLGLTVQYSRGDVHVHAI